VFTDKEITDIFLHISHCYLFAIDNSPLSELVRLMQNIESSVTKASVDDSLQWRVSPKPRSLKKWLTSVG